MSITADCKRVPQCGLWRYCPTCYMLPWIEDPWYRLDNQDTINQCLSGDCKRVPQCGLYGFLLHLTIKTVYNNWMLISQGDCKSVPQCGLCSYYLVCCIWRSRQFKITRSLSHRGLQEGYRVWSLGYLAWSLHVTFVQCTMKIRPLRETWQSRKYLMNKSRSMSEKTARAILTVVCGAC